MSIPDASLLRSLGPYAPYAVLIATVTGISNLVMEGKATVEQALTAYVLIVAIGVLYGLAMIWVGTGRQFRGELSAHILRMDAHITRLEQRDEKLMQVVDANTRAITSFGELFDIESRLKRIVEVYAEERGGGEGPHGVDGAGTHEATHTPSGNPAGGQT